VLDPYSQISKFRQTNASINNSKSETFDGSKNWKKEYKLTSVRQDQMSPRVGSGGPGLRGFRCPIFWSTVRTFIHATPETSSLEEFLPGLESSPLIESVFCSR